MNAQRAFFCSVILATTDFFLILIPQKKEVRQLKFTDCTNPWSTDPLF